MEKLTKSLNFTSERLDVLVFESKPSRFRQEWFYLFRSELSPVLSRLQPYARAILLDAIVLGNLSPQGLLCVTPKALAGRQIGRATFFNALSRLESFNLVRRVNDLVYVSPKLVYRGRSKDWPLALKFWSTLLGELPADES